MVSDSIAAVPVLSAANTKNPGKKKRTNRSAKLKQYKIDARREQWLSQGAVKNKGFKDGIDDEGNAPLSPVMKHDKRSMEEPETRRRDDDEFIHQDSDLELPSNSPVSPNSSVLCGNDSGTNFTGSSSGGGSSSSSSSSCTGCCSGNITEEDEEEEEEEEEEEDDDDGCLDDWEAMADALAADDERQNPGLDDESVVQMDSPRQGSNGLNLGSPNSKQGSGRIVPWGSGNCKAWRADDAFRPQTLPNLSKQHSMPNPDRRFGGGIPWSRTSVPSPCPICFEDLDLTDTSFLPCLCGFRLCLFCHKRILEQDSRCPGCRKPYECEPVETEASVLGGSLTLKLARSCSMIERS